MNIGEKLTENRHVVYFSRFCQILFSACVPNVEIDEEDVIPSFKLHKRVFSDLTNKDLKKVNVGELLLPERVLQFLHPEPQQQQESVNPEVFPSQPQSQVEDSEPIQSTSVKPKSSGRVKHRAFKPAKSVRSTNEAGVSNADDMPQKKRLKKRRANRAQSAAITEESETDDETLHQRKRRLVAAHLFGASNVAPEDILQEEIFDTHVPTEDRVNAETGMIHSEKEAPTSKSDDVVEEAANEATMFTDDRAHVEIAVEAPEIIVQEVTENVEAAFMPDLANAEAEAEIFEPQGFHMEVEANISINSEHFTEGLEADQDTVEIEESMASHTQIISFEFEKGEEVDQTLVANATETVTANPDVTHKDATENVPIEVEFVANSEIHEAEQINTETAAEHVPEENSAEDDNVEDSPAHSHPDMQTELSDIQANSAEEREVNRATAEHFQEMYYNKWADADCIFSAQRAADFLGDSVKTISNPDVITSLKATVIQIKSLHNRFDESHKEVTALRNEVGMRDLTLKNDRSYYNQMFKKQAKDSDEIQKRLGKVEENQTAMSAQLTSISNAIELLTSVLLSDDVKKGESVPNDKCKVTQTLRRRDDGNDDGNKGDRRSLKLNHDRRLPRRSNSDRRSNSGKGNVNSASGSKLKSLIISDKPTTDEEIATKIFLEEHGGEVTVEDYDAELRMINEEHQKKMEDGTYKKKGKAPRRKEIGISIKDNVNSDQSLQYSRRSTIERNDKGKGKLVEEEQLPKKIYSTSDIAQVETRLVKSTSDAAQVDVSTKAMTTSDVSQVVQKSTQLPGFSKPKILEDLKLEAVKFSETRTVLGKEAFDKSGLGSHRERRTNNRSQDNISLAEPEAVFVILHE
ncbi:hypothetical protein POM88_015892 [Heracleum sosnowskyi]|uniref:Uncharacterized protein n=1 Tax=Heracleum sosnowskyi TaxID=360622 RepID=A0AAD8IKP9_9APIA|nr:hypothetical protein POM88_015892 [Heracleum sosnowskyi]